MGNGLRAGAVVVRSSPLASNSDPSGPTLPSSSSTGSRGSPRMTPCCTPEKPCRLTPRVALSALRSTMPRPAMRGWFMDGVCRYRDRARRGRPVDRSSMSGSLTTSAYSSSDICGARPTAQWRVKNSPCTRAARAGLARRPWRGRALYSTSKHAPLTSPPGGESTWRCAAVPAPRRAR